MQHKGVSCGPLSFIHAAAACELPAWQSCRRVLWHPVDSSSHSSIRGPRSRAGAHLHEKYMDTVLTYVTVTTIFFYYYFPVTQEVSYFETSKTPQRQSHYGVIHLGLFYHIYLWADDVCLCQQRDMLCVMWHRGPVQSSRSALLATLKEAAPLHKRREQATVVPAHSGQHLCRYAQIPLLPAGNVIKVQKWRSGAEVTHPVHLTASPHKPLNFAWPASCVGGGW